MESPVPIVAPLAETASSPPPPNCEDDRSGGVRAYVTIHARTVRRPVP